MVLVSGCRLGQRLAGLDDVNPQHFERFVAGFGIVNGALRNLVGLAGLDFHRRLAVDQELKLALEHITGFGAGMGMAARRAIRGNFGYRGNRVVAGREVKFLQWRALDAALLGDGNACDATTVNPSMIFLITMFLLPARCAGLQQARAKG
jgi:hypothetical protein